jgi:hypothetical protein
LDLNEEPTVKALYRKSLCRDRVLAKQIVPLTFLAKPSAKRILIRRGLFGRASIKNSDSV